MTVGSWRTMTGDAEMRTCGTANVGNDKMLSAAREWDVRVDDHGVQERVIRKAGSGRDISKRTAGLASFLHV